MGRKHKYNYDLMIKICKEYEKGGCSFKDLSLKYDINRHRIKAIYYKYSTFGAESLKDTSKNKSYSKEIKIKIINEYLTGNYSYRDLSMKYKIERNNIVRWVLEHKNGKTRYNSGTKGADIMSRKTTLNERIEIVKDLIKNELDYNATSKKYNVSYTQVYQWHKKYQEKGVDGLIDRRGRRKIEDELTPEEQSNLEVKRLKKELELAKATIEVLKKNIEIAEKLGKTK